MNKKKVLKLSSLLMLSLFLCGCSDVPLDSNQFLDRISFNLWDFLAVFAAFIILIVIAFFFGYKPVKAYIKKRKDYIEGNIKTAEDRELKSRNIINEANEKAKEKQKEALLIVEKAKEDANKQKEQIINEAKDEAQNQIKNAQNQIAREIEASKDDIHKQIVDVALNASTKILEREVNEKDNERLIDSFVNDLKKDNK